MLMPREVIKVPYGYVPPAATRKGTLIAYGEFESMDSALWLQLLRAADERAFERLVLYPIHEETGKRMGLGTLSAYYKRLERVEELVQDTLEGKEGMRAPVPILIDKWEGKRRKYTPIDTALTFLTEKYPGPHFVYMSEDFAARFAVYQSFEEWIRKIRLLLAPPYGNRLPSKLTAASNRWEYVQEHESNG